MNSDHPKLLICAHRQKPCAKSTGTDSIPWICGRWYVGILPVLSLPARENESFSLDSPCQKCSLLLGSVHVLSTLQGGPKVTSCDWSYRFNFRPFLGVITFDPAFQLGSGFHLLAPKIPRRFRPQHLVFLGGISGPNIPSRPTCTRCSMLFNLTAQTLQSGRYILKFSKQMKNQG